MQWKDVILKRRYYERAYAYFGPLLRKARALTHEETAHLLEDAEEHGVLSADERYEAAWADVIMRGAWIPDGRQVMVLAEVWSVIDRCDVVRALDRAALLAKLGTPVVPVVAGDSITERAARMARSRNVLQVLDGRRLSHAGEYAT